MTITAGLGGTLEDRGLRETSMRLAVGAALLLAALPAVMALANRSAPLVLALAAALAAASVASRVGWRGLGRVLAASLRSPLGFGTGAFVVLSLASCEWSADPGETLRTLTQVAAPLIAGVLVLTLRARFAPRPASAAVAIGCLVAALICIVELRLGMPLRNALHLRAKAFEYNRPALTLLVLFWPLCAAAFEARRQPLPWLALAAITIAIWSSQSGTAMFAQAISVVAVAFAWRFPRGSLLVTALAVVLVFALIFAFGDIALDLLPGETYRALAWTHAADRVEIWRSFGAVMRMHPWLGIGFGTSATLADTPVAGEVASEFRRMLAVGHPHNGYLQIGVELGLAGCVIALAVALTLLWSWRKLSGTLLTARIGLFTMAAATMLVGHGAWQAWWIAVLFAGAAATRMVSGGDSDWKAGMDPP